MIAIQNQIKQISMRNRKLLGRYIEIETCIKRDRQKKAVSPKAFNYKKFKEINTDDFMAFKQSVRSAMSKSLYY